MSSIGNSLIIFTLAIVSISANQEVPELVNRVKEKLANVDQLVENMAQEHEDMLNKVADLENQVDMLQEFQRRDNIEMGNFPKRDNENLESVVFKLAKLINMPIEETDICVVSRVLPNKLDKDIVRAQPVIIRFTSRKIRDRFFNAYKSALLKYNGLDEDYRTFYDKIMRSHDLKWFTAKQLDSTVPGDKDGNIFLNDHLAPRKKILFTKARAKARELGYQNVWVDDHRIYVQRDDSMRPFIVGRETDLKKMDMGDQGF
uniref:FP protein C-terminal domain-containing protein n=1 Tax=Cacopsylla melanoneura TaxID=428564 RepID=A0A8D9AG33_9HEMI